MNEKTIDLVQQLSDKLGMSTETLIGWFASRAPYEFVSVGISLMVIAIGVLIFKAAVDYGNKTKKERSADDDIGASATIGGFMVIGVLFMFVGCITFSDNIYHAIMAVAAPEAYAVEKIASLFTSG